MKKNAQLVATETKAAKKLFGIAVDDLQAVRGGGGIIVNPKAKVGTGG